MIQRKSFKQITPALMWEVPMESPTWTRARPLAAYAANGDSMEIDSWEFTGGVLKVNFGLDPVAGELEYEYQVPGNGSTIVDSAGNVVNITVNQYSGQ